MVFILLFLLSTLFTGMIAMTLKRHKLQVEYRLKKYFLEETNDENKKTASGRTIEKDNRDAFLRPAFQRFSRIFRGKKQTEKWTELIETSGVPIKSEEFMAIRLLSVLLTLMTAFAMELNLMMVILLPLIGWFGPGRYLKHKRKKRIQACSDQLPQALGTISTAMKSGFSFMQAMQLVSKEVSDPLGTEFAKAIREMNLGVSMEQSFQNLLSRLPNKDLKLVVTAVLIQRSTGGNLSKLFETIEETIHERIRMKDELKTLTSQGRMSAIIISLLPVVLGLILNVASPSYFSPMLEHPLGLAFLAMGAVSGFIGWLVIQKIVRIEV
ncbi:secretion system protein [Virgibacillus sp. MSP4-1]|uniref:type II secretion system F family protein n=1 Tax=Virgibacillus sp. MSP4-1 TaxID=2700081 RepID=UPI0003A3FD1B|nr:type II secretion system F family protein [Virgibacillus sp. MSP4-1]QHS22499.1 secretion system protein [Virgibacillus sp. MSP4-1]